MADDRALKAERIERFIALYNELEEFMSGEFLGVNSIDLDIDDKYNRFYRVVYTHYIGEGQREQLAAEGIVLPKW